jgi:hypothetical protein
MAPRVSGWSVGQQLDHVVKVNGSVLSRIFKNSEVPGRGISLVGRAVLLVGYLPRGMGRSPEHLRGETRPASQIADAHASVGRSLGLLSARQDLLSGKVQVISHPYFGSLTALEGIRFLVVHSRHHLRIARDIERATLLS